MRDLARRLLVASQSASPPDPHVPEPLRVVAKLRVSLTRLVGADGFTSLLRRALALVSADVPSLQSVKIGADGRLQGLEQIVADSTGAGGAAAVALTTHLLALLATFIGESLTLRLVRESWPDAALDE